MADEEERSTNPQREVLLQARGHTLYRLARGVIMLEPAGDVDAASMKAVLDVLEQLEREGVKAVVLDIGRLGHITKEARRVRAERTSVLNMKDARVYVANATVVTRATLTMLFTARKLVTRQALHVQFVGDREQAIRRALEDGEVGS